MMSNYGLLVSLAIQMVVLTGVLGVLSFFQRYANSFFSQKVAYDVRNDVFKALQRQSFAFYDKTQTGQIMSRTTTDVERIQGFLGWQIMELIGSLFLLVGVIISMVLIDLELSLLSFSIIPFVLLGFRYFGKRIRSVIHAAREHFGSLTSTLWENLVGTRVVRSFAREEFEKKKFHEPNKNYYDTMLESVKLRSLFMPFASFLIGLIMIAVYVYGGLDVINNRLTIDELYVFSIYLNMLMRPAFMLGMLWTGYQTMVAAGERVFEIIDAVPEVKDKPNAITLPPINGHVVLEDVSFGYDKDRLILKKINLDVKPGETVALLGPTGSGKSTIIQLIPRFYDSTSGRILIDGYDVRDVKIESLRRQIGIVSQAIFLFNRTIKDNIAFGRPDATMDEIIHAAEIAKAHSFIMNLPKGYDTVLGERGINLSGGQRQRIAIARALLMNPRILILDDSTSSVDVDTEYEIQQALSALLKERTAFIITQRVSTIRNADRIIVLEDGRIVEEGNHDELMRNKGAYYRIYQTLYKAQKEILTSETSSPQIPAEDETSNKDSEGRKS